LKKEQDEQQELAQPCCPFRVLDKCRAEEKFGTHSHHDFDVMGLKTLNIE